MSANIFSSAFILFVFLIPLASNVAVLGQRSLPPCPSTGKFDLCYGAYISPDGNKYVGEWRDDKMNGEGTRTSSNGDKYVGEWRDSKNVLATVTDVKGDPLLGRSFLKRLKSWSIDNASNELILVP